MALELTVGMLLRLAVMQTTSWKGSEALIVSVFPDLVTDTARLELEKLNSDRTPLESVSVRL